MTATATVGTVSVRLDVSLDDDAYQHILDLLDGHPRLWRLYDERAARTRMILMGLDVDLKPAHAGMLPIDEFQSAIVRAATVRGYLEVEGKGLTVNPGRFSVAEVGEIAQKLAFGGDYYGAS